MAVAVAAGSLASLHASTPKFFQAETQTDFLRGDVENLSIDINGQLVLGPATELVYETAAPFLWSMLPASDGSLFVGTGNEGKVFRIDSEGRGSLFFDSAELEVHALAPAPNGGLYVATSPDGKIYKVDRAGAATTFFDPDDKYIWSLAVDANGNLFAGTGEKGVIYKITPDGKGAPFYKTNATHATALAFDKGGNLIVGTGSPGRVLKVDPDGKPFVLLDSPYQEDPRAAVRRQGRAVRRGAQRPHCVAARRHRRATAGGDQPAPQDRAPIATVSVSTEITAIAVVDTSSASAPAARDDQRGVKGAVYRISPDGVWDELWESRDDSPYDLSFDQSGAGRHRYRQQGQDLPARRRSGAPDAARPRQRTAGHRLPQGFAAAGSITPPRTPARSSGSPPSVPRAAPTNPSRATRR